MPSKAQPHRNRKPGAELRSPQPHTPTLDAPIQLSHLASIVQRARLAPSSLTPSVMLQAQRIFGNRAVGELLAAGKQGSVSQGVASPIQAKLTVGPVGDAYEQEADRVSERVVAQSNQPREDEELQMRPAAPTIQLQEEEEEELQMRPAVQRQEDEELQASPAKRIWRQAEEEEESLQAKPSVQRQAEEEEELQAKPLLRRQAEEEEEALQAKPRLQQRQDGSLNPGGDLDSRLVAHKGRGTPLPEDARAFMEPRFGTDFGGVRVHTDSEAVQLTQDLQAQAFTSGQDIYFGQGGLDLGTGAGKRLLAHELTHVVQQGAGTKRDAASTNTTGSIAPLPHAGTIQRSSTTSQGENQEPEPEVPQEVEQAPVVENVPESPISKTLQKINDLIASGGGKRTVVWTKDTFESQKGGKGSSTEYEDIGKALDAYHDLQEDTQELVGRKSVKAMNVGGAIRSWKAKNKSLLRHPNRRKAINKLAVQASSEKKRLNDLHATYELARICQQAENIRIRPLSAGRKWAIADLEKKIKDFDIDILRKLRHDPTALKKTLGNQVFTTISQLKRDIERMEKERAPKLPKWKQEEKEKRFEEEMETQMRVLGLAAKGGQASLFELGHKLEALDPKHRDYNLLNNLFGSWLQKDTQGDTPANFFEWVDKYEREEVARPLRETRYITKEDERRKYKLGFKGALPYYVERRAYYQASQKEKHEGKGERTEDKAFGKGIYVMTPEKEFYARFEDPTRSKTFHHSSFLAGFPIAAAGHMKTATGLHIDLESGHYHPRMEQMLNAVKGLKAKGVGPEEVNVRPYPTALSKLPQSMSGQDFLDELETLKSSNGQDGGVLKQIADLKLTAKGDPEASEQLIEAYKAS